MAVYAGVGGAAMVAAQQPGFPARGDTLYVFSIGGASNNSAPGLISGKPGKPAAQPDNTSPSRT